MEIVCANGNNMVAFGLDNREKIKSIQEPSDVWCEEMTEFEQEDITQLLLRLRTKKAKYNQLVGSFNPISTEHWIYDSLVVKKQMGAVMIKSTYHDNKFLPPEYTQYLESLKESDPNYYKIYCLGEWGGQIKGLIYPTWNLSTHAPQFADTIYGLDFGFNHPTALIKVGLVEKHIYAQQKLYKSGLTIDDLIKELHTLDIGKAPIYADNARPEAIEQIFRAGFNIKPADKGKDSVVTGISTVRSCTINIMDDSPDLIKEIRNYRWSEDKNGNSVEGKPVKFLDDAMDAMRYAIHTHIGRPKGTFKVSVI